MDVTRECFFEGLKAARAGNHLNDIPRQSVLMLPNIIMGLSATWLDMESALTFMRIRRSPNFPQKRRGVRLMPGMTLAVEPMINLGRADVAWLDDEWTVVTMDGSLSAHYENTILITDGDPEILTLTK